MEDKHIHQWYKDLLKVLKDINADLFLATPHGFACFIITVAESFFIDDKISKAAKISL